MKQSVDRVKQVCGIDSLKRPMPLGREEMWRFAVGLGNVQSLIMMMMEAGWVCRALCSSSPDGLRFGRFCKPHATLPPASPSKLTAFPPESTGMNCNTSQKQREFLIILYSNHMKEASILKYVYYSYTYLSDVVKVIYSNPSSPACLTTA